MLRFLLPYETPAKKNSRVYLKNGFNIPSKNYREWHEKAKQSVIEQMKMQDADLVTPVENEVRIKLTFYHGDQRRRDSDNGTSSILDLLQDCNVLKDDCWQVVRAIEVLNYYEKNDAKCIVEIKAFEKTM